MSQIATKSINLLSAELKLKQRNIARGWFQVEVVETWAT